MGGKNIKAGHFFAAIFLPGFLPSEWYRFVIPPFTRFPPVQILCLVAA